MKVNDWRAVLIKATELTIGTRFVGCGIAQFADLKSVDCKYKQRTIATMIGLSERTVRAGIAELVKAGFVVISKRGARGANVMQLVLPTGIRMPVTPNLTGTVVPVTRQNAAGRTGIRMPVRSYHESLSRESDQEGRHRPSVDTAMEEEDGMTESQITGSTVKRPSAIEHARVTITNAVARLLKMTPDERVNGVHADKWAFEKIPPYLVNELIDKLMAGKLTEEYLGEILTRLGIDQALADVRAA